VVDTSNKYYKRQIDVTNQTLEEIGVHDIPTLYIYNKFDLLNTEIKPTHFPNIIVSLLQENGISKVISFLNKELFKEFEIVEMLIPYDKGDLVSFLNEHNHVVSQEYDDIGTILHVELSQIQIGKYSQYIKK
jgi:GTP-binding protein HflX